MKDWEQFENAVATFLQALEPTATAKRDVRIPDRDTGEPRQYDVWVEKKLGGHIPLKILISCKRHKRKLNQHHIDSFSGELRSSGADKGVIYSYSGFTKPALKKCKRLGISACQLYQNQKSDLPEGILLYAYCCRSKMTIGLLYNTEIPSKYTVWNDLLNQEFTDKKSKQFFIDFLIFKIEELEQKAVREKVSNEPFPPQKKDRFWVRDEEGNELGIEILVDWEVFEAEIGASIVNGSYSITDRDFKGAQTIPSINGSGPDPGPGWVLLRPPYKLKTPGVTVIQHKQNMSKPIREHLGPMLLRQS